MMRRSSAPPGRDVPGRDALGRQGSAAAAADFPPRPADSPEEAHRAAGGCGRCARSRATPLGVPARRARDPPRRDPAGAAARSGPATRLVLPLFGGALPATAQDAGAGARASRAAARFVLATKHRRDQPHHSPACALVVDSGLVRRARFDPATGMGRLETGGAFSRGLRGSASAERARARGGMGVCYRAWSGRAHTTPLAGLHAAGEIAAADLAPLALELASWGVQDAGVRCRWLDAPPAALLASARDLLTRLGALDGLRPHQRRGPHDGAARQCIRAWHTCCCARPASSSKLPPRPRRLGGRCCRSVICCAAANPAMADIRTRLEVLQGAATVGADRGTLRGGATPHGARAREAAPRRHRHSLPAPARRGDPRPAARLSPTRNRIGRRRAGGEGRFTLAKRTRRLVPGAGTSLGPAGNDRGARAGRSRSATRRAFCWPRRSARDALARALRRARLPTARVGRMELARGRRSSRGVR